MAEDEYNGRRQQIESHIQLLEKRYPEPERQEAIAALQERLRSLELESQQ